MKFTVSNVELLVKELAKFIRPTASRNSSTDTLIDSPIGFILSWRNFEA